MKIICSTLFYKDIFKINTCLCCVQSFKRTKDENYGRIYLPYFILETIIPYNFSSVKSY